MSDETKINTKTESSTLYSIKPNIRDSFKPLKVKEILEQTMSEVLTGKKYSESEAIEWTKSISDKINLRVKELNMKRYKHVTQVIIGHQLGAGCKYITRCRWDADCDNQSSDVFTNATIFCVSTVFGVYHY